MENAEPVLMLGALMSARASSVGDGDIPVSVTPAPRGIEPDAGGECVAGGDGRESAGRSWGPATVALAVGVAVGVVVVAGAVLTVASPGGERSWWSVLVRAVSAGREVLTSPHWVSPLLADTGWFAPVVFVVGFVVVTSLGVPRTVLTLAAGWVFGVGAGLLLAWGASLLAAWAGYEMARFVVAARTSVRRRPRARDSWRESDGPSRRGMEWRASAGRARERMGDAVAARAGDRREVALAVVSARLVPVLPFAVVNYACGCLRLSRRAFVLGSAAGLLPGAAAYAVLGAGLAVPGWVQLGTAASGTAIAAGAVCAAVVKRRRSALTRT